MTNYIVHQLSTENVVNTDPQNVQNCKFQFKTDIIFYFLTKVVDLRRLSASIAHYAHGCD